MDTEQTWHAMEKLLQYPDKSFRENAEIRVTH